MARESVQAPRCMRVAFDTNPVYTSRAGVARYVRGMLTGFKAVDDLEVMPLRWPVANLGFRQPERLIKTFYREVVWNHWSVPRLLRKTEPDLIHSTSPFLSRKIGLIPHLITLHDLAVLRRPERFRRWHRNSARRALSRLHRADRVICISQFTADEAIALLNLTAHQLIVIHNGCDFVSTVPEEAQPATAVPDEFFLFVGTLEPGKNLSLLRNVWAAAQRRGESLPPLMVVGARWHGIPNEGSPPQNWTYLGHLSDAELVYLYRRARALLFPSTYEGFGLPTVEAMALGCPVICSPVASLPEITGDAALMTELNPNAYEAAIRRLGRECSLRDALVQAGRERSARFRWETTAREVADCYRELAR